MPRNTRGIFLLSLNKSQCFSGYRDSTLVIEDTKNETLC